MDIVNAVLWRDVHTFGSRVSGGQISLKSVPNLLYIRLVQARTGGPGDRAATVVRAVLGGEANEGETFRER